jgi:hypothetical protein
MFLTNITNRSFEFNLTWQTNSIELSFFGTFDNAVFSITDLSKKNTKLKQNISKKENEQLVDISQKITLIKNIKTVIDLSNVSLNQIPNPENLFKEAFSTLPKNILILYSIKSLHPDLKQLFSGALN